MITTEVHILILQSVVESLSGIESQISTMEDEVQQISIEAGPSDSAHIQQQVSSLADQARQLRANAQAKLASLEGVVGERAAFEKELASCLNWLNQREKSVGPLDSLSLASVDHELAQIEGVEKQVSSRLKPVLEQTEAQRAGYRELDENVPLELSDKMEQVETTAQNLQVLYIFFSNHCRVL